MSSIRVQDREIADSRSLQTYFVGHASTSMAEVLADWALSDILGGTDVFVIDPDGGLFSHLVGRLSKIAPKHRDLYERTRIVTPTDPVWAFGFNPLLRPACVPTERWYIHLSETLLSFWCVDNKALPHCKRLLALSFLALAEAGRGIVELPRLWFDADWQDELLRRSANRSVIDYFTEDYPCTRSAIRNWINPIHDHLQLLLADTDVRAMLAARSLPSWHTPSSYPTVMLANLCQPILGEYQGGLLGALITGQICEWLLSRPFNPGGPGAVLYVNNFNDYARSQLARLLAGPRTKRYSVRFAHQYLGQIPIDEQQVLLSTSDQLVCFQTSFMDNCSLELDLLPTVVPGRPRRSQTSRTHKAGKSQDHDVHDGKVALLASNEYLVRRLGNESVTKHRWIPGPKATVADKHLYESFIDAIGRKSGVTKSELRI